MVSFAHTIHAIPKYVVSSTLEAVDWNNAELVRGDLGEFVRELKSRPGRGIAVGGVTLPLALVEPGLIDEYEFIIHPRIVGQGRSLSLSSSSLSLFSLSDRPGRSTWN